MATLKENILNSIKWLIPNLDKRFAPIKHTHTKSDITDFPKIPTSIGDLTTSSISYDSKNNLLKVYTNFEAQSTNGNSLYIDSERYKLASTDGIVLDSPNVTFTGGNLVVSKNNKDTCQLGTNIVDTEANGAIALYNNDLENNNSWSTSIYTQQHLTSDIVLNLPGKSGTFALTSDIPTWNSLKPNVVTFDGIALDGNGAYVYGDQTNQTGMIYFRYKANKTDTDFSYANIAGLTNGANQAWKCLPYTGGTLAGNNTTTPLTIKGTNSGTVESSIKYLGNDDNSTCWVVGQGTNGTGVDSFGFYSYKAGRNVVRFDTDGNITNSGYAVTNGMIRSNYEFSSMRDGKTDWRFGSASGVGSHDWFGFVWTQNGTNSCPFYFHKDGTTRCTGEYQSTGVNFLRSVYGNYGVIFRNDGDYMWILRTTSGNQYGNWKEDHIPFKMHISTTDINFCGRYLLSDAVYNTTQSGSANMIITQSHTIKRISSASKYKLDIQNINKEDDYAYNLLKLNPRQWFDKGAIERYSEYLTDKANDAIDEDKPYMEREDATQLYYGLVAEDLESAGLSEFCTYVKNKDGEKEIDSVQYDRVPILTIPILRDLVVCMQKILPTVQEQLDDNTKAEVAKLLNKFNSFDQNEIINNIYDDSKK